MWYNQKTGELQSEKPGKTIIDEMYWNEVYGDWREVELSFVPPPKEMSKAEKIKALNAEYSEAIATLEAGVYRAEIINKSTTAAAAQRAKLQSVQAELKQKILEVQNG